MKTGCYSRLIRLPIFITTFIFIIGSCGFKLRTNHYQLINGGSNLYLAPVTSVIFTGGIEEKLFETLINNIRKKRGISIVSRKNAELVLAVHIEKYDEFTDNNISGVNTLDHSMRVKVTITNSDSKNPVADVSTVEKSLSTETVGTIANDAEITENSNKLIEIVAEDIIGTVVVQ